MRLLSRKVSKPSMAIHRSTAIVQFVDTLVPQQKGVSKPSMAIHRSTVAEKCREPKSPPPRLKAFNGHSSVDPASVTPAVPAVSKAVSGDLRDLPQIRPQKAENRLSISQGGFATLGSNISPRWGDGIRAVVSLSGTPTGSDISAQGPREARTLGLLGSKIFH